MKDKILERLGKIVSIVLLAFGIVTLAITVSTMKIGSFSRPQEGFTPCLFSSLLICFSIINIVIEFKSPNKVPGELGDVNWVKFFLYFLICILYVFLVKKIGFATDTFISLALMLKLAGLKSWVKAALLSLIASVLIWALFTFAMGVRLPSGILI